MNSQHADMFFVPSSTFIVLLFTFFWENLTEDWKNSILQRNDFTGLGSTLKTGVFTIVNSCKMLQIQCFLF